jgi:large subunit ribosomal protein L13e
LLTSLLLQAAEVATAVQLRGALFPVEQPAAGPEARAITAEEKKTNAYMKLRYARSAARTLGAREKRARDKAEEEASKKK